MTVSTTARFVRHLGTGVQLTTYAVPFQFYEIDVYVDQVLKSNGVHYTIVGGNGSTGTVQFMLGQVPALNAVIDIVGAQTMQQQTQYENFDDAPGELYEKSVDQLTMMVRELDEKIGRSIRGSIHHSQVAPLDFENNPETFVYVDDNGLLSLKTLDEVVPGFSDAVATVAADLALAVAARVAAQAAQAAAEIAKTGAETARTGAETARTGAETARTGAETARTGAEAAQTAANVSANAAAQSVANLSGTSSTSNTIGTGSKSFVTQAGKSFNPGTFLLIFQTSQPTTNWFFGQVTSYSGTALDVLVAVSNGGGTHSDWTIQVTGARGAQGIQGIQGIQGVPGQPLNIGDPNQDRILVWDDSANDIAAIALADLTNEGAPAAGDYLLMYRAEGDLVKVDWNLLPAGGGGGVSDGDKGDITVSAAGATWTIDNDVVTYAKMQNVSATSRILGRITAGAGDTEELTAANVKTILALVAADLSDFTEAVQDVVGALLGADGGDLDWTYNDGANTLDAVVKANAITTSKIIDDAVTFAKMQNIATDKLLGRVSASTGDVEEVTCTDFAQSLLDDANAATALATLTARGQGKDTMWIPASAMLPALTNGPSSGSTDSGTNDLMYRTLDFDATTAESAWFTVAFPKSWNEGTVTFQVFWTSTATDSDGMATGLAAVAVGDNTDINGTAVGTEVVVTDDLQAAAQKMLVSAESSAVTIAGTPAVDKVVFFRVRRVVSDANDDMIEDMKLIGIKLFFTTDAANDA